MRAHHLWPILLALPPLIWPALLNGYPIVFSDTGTYLSQAIHLYLGWDRPAFYSVFMMALHLTLTTWPVVIAQALCVVLVLDCARAGFFPDMPRALLPLLALSLSVLTGLPWLVSHLMPDLFTPLLVLAMAMLIFIPERLPRGAPIPLWLAAVAMTSVHQSNVPLCIGLLLCLLPARRWFGARVALGARGVLRLLAIPALALLAMTAVNFAAHRQASPSPYGNVFVLARIIYDGPGLRVLRRECPRPDWRLCAELQRFPRTSDEFLWDQNGPVIRAGGAKIISREATPIILAALWAEPWSQLRGTVLNTLRQLLRFSPADGLHPWPETVSPWIERDFPAAERVRYADARQTRGELAVPAWIEQTDRASVVLGLIGLTALLRRSRRQRDPRAGLCAAVLLALLGNAMITGGLSAPHDRYQSRVVWLPAAIALMALPGGRLLSGARATRALARAALTEGSSLRSRAYA